MHDIVSHSISVITIQAQAVRRRLNADQNSEIDDLQDIEDTARQAMAEMRRLLGVLRADGPAALAPREMQLRCRRDSTSPHIASSRRR